MQEAHTSLAAAHALTNELLRVWFRDDPVNAESRAAAARALDGVDWSAASSQPLALYLRGGLLLLSAAPLPTPAAAPDRRRAASLMEAAVKLQPCLAEAWVVLGAMHSQAGQLVMALHCLSCGLAARVTPQGLRAMSLVLRRLAASTGALPQERAEAAAASLAAAKQAVALDVTDGFSWYVLGMAHVAAAAAPPPPAAAATALSCDQSPSTLQLKQQQQQQLSSPGAASSCAEEAAAADVSARAALAAFTAAERSGLASLPELWFNRAAVALHLGELGLALQVNAWTVSRAVMSRDAAVALHLGEQGLALQDFTTAARLDPCLPAAAQVAAISRLLAALAACTGSSSSSRGSGSRRTGLQPQQEAALKAALSHDLAAHLSQQLLPAGCQLRLPGCAQWVCVAMSSCGGCFPMLLPGALDLQQLLGCCLLLLGPACSRAALPANREGQESGQGTHTVNGVNAGGWTNY
ncbi:hypothetical protein OEZ86_008838 [Tetradesmus obliquus]|nr:hypothetical protein OEZ86_008838 [Tetradesmus obliquus]